MPDADKLELIAVTPDDMEKVINAIVDNPDPRWSAMTYEQGVRAALEWVLGEEDHNPLDD